MKRLILFMAMCGIVSYASATFTTTGLQLHLEADSLSLNDGDTVSTWADLAGGDNDAINTAGGTPTYIANGLNGHAVVSITGSLSADGYSWTGQNTDYFDLESAVHNIQTIAMVFKKTSNNYYGGDICMFGSEATGWVDEAFNGDHAWGTTYYSYEYSDPAVKYGGVRIDGAAAVDGGYTAVPFEYHVMVFQIQQGWGSDININQIASATDHNSYVWGMDVAEILAYDTYLDASEVAAVESYLTDKYFTSVPEPATMVLLGLGVCFLRRKK